MDEWKEFDRTLKDTQKLALLRMQQFDELVAALRRCHLVLITMRYIEGGNVTLNDVIWQAEKILTAVEATGNENDHSNGVG